MYQGKYAAPDNGSKKAGKPAPRRPAAPRAAAPVPEKPQTPAAPVRREPPKRRPRKKPSYFYPIYFSCIVVFFIVLFFMMSPLKNWLTRFEASQPDHKRDEVFAQLFENPDWGQIYTLAGLEDSKFENKDTFRAYMEELVGGRELTCRETSAGLSGDKKFIVKVGDTKIASFLLTGGAGKDTDIPNWELGTVEVFFQRTQSITVEKLPGQTVRINGIDLDDSYTIRSISTLAENYLPEGTHGCRVEQQQVTGLLAVPEVTVVNPDGSLANVTLDEDTGVYTQALPTFEPGAEQKELAATAMQAYGKYMIQKCTESEVRKYFDTKVAASIFSSDTGWTQAFASYSFTDAVISNYYVYSDTMFSLSVATSLNCTRFDGSIKEWPMSSTLFFTKNSSGKWIVTEMTNVDVQQKKEQVRLTFMDGDNILSDEMVDAHASKLTLPAVTVPEGKVFAGWVKRETAANGSVTLTVVFEDGPAAAEVYLPEGEGLEPMTLYALFEDGGAEE